MAKIYDLFTKKVVYDSEVEDQKLGRDYSKWDFTSLANESIRFANQQRKQKVFTPELIEWGIPLYQELIKRDKDNYRLEKYHFILQYLISQNKVKVS